MRIAGILPTELGLLTTLEELDLRENQLTGKIPSEIGVLTSAVDLSEFYTCIYNKVYFVTNIISFALRQV
jgi:Leucine-rich repeat (LRR) protein